MSDYIWKTLDDAPIETASYIEIDTGRDRSDNLSRATRVLPFARAIEELSTDKTMRKQKIRWRYWEPPVFE